MLFLIQLQHGRSNASILFEIKSRSDEDSYPVKEKKLRRKFIIIFVSMIVFHMGLYIFQKTEGKTLLS